MTDQPSDDTHAHDAAPLKGQDKGQDKDPRDLGRVSPASAAHVALRWPFPAGSQNDTDKAVKLKPYVQPKRRTLNQY